jgi:integrase
VSDRDLDGYRAYLNEFGLSEGTIDIYVHQMRRAIQQGGAVARLKSELAPKTKRLVRAAARHWADWQEDKKLRRELDRIRLPAARRQKAKVPLPREVMLNFMREVERDPRLSPALRAVIGLMAFRGFRDGDVLRMQRHEIAAALKHGTLAYEAKGKRRLEFQVIRTYRRWLELLHSLPKWHVVDELIATSPTPKGRRKQAARNVQRAMRRIGKRLGIEGLHPHQLRRTYCVEYLRALKGDPEALMKLKEHMQWANVATAMEYVDHLRGKALDAVAETLFEREED